VPSRIVVVESVGFLAVGACIVGIIVGVITGSLRSLVAPAVVGGLYLLVALPRIHDVTEPCNGWCSEQTWSAGFLRIVVTIFILGFGVLPGMGGAAIGVWLREKIDAKP
jgi:hypothetical protein